MGSALKKIVTGLLFTLLVVIFVFSLFFAYPVYKNYNKKRDEYHKVQAELDARIAECAALNREVHDLENMPSAVEKVAREKYKLCKEGELILRYEDSH